MDRKQRAAEILKGDKKYAELLTEEKKLEIEILHDRAEEAKADRLLTEKKLVRELLEKDVTFRDPESIEQISKLGYRIKSLDAQLAIRASQLGPVPTTDDLRRALKRVVKEMGADHYRELLAFSEFARVVNNLFSPISPVLKPSMFVRIADYLKSKLNLLRN